LNIVVPANTTLGEMRELLYLKYNSLLAAVDIEIWTHRRSVLAKETSFNSYIQEVRSRTSLAALGLKKYTSTVEAPPGLIDTQDDAVYTTAAKRFAQMVQEMARERDKRSREKQKELEKRQKDKDKVLNMSAEEVLESKFRQIAENIKSPKKPKNGTTPGGASGHNPNPAPWNNGKGKGKGSGKSKGNGKGKSKNEQNGKGKGKGKAKGSQPSEQPFWRTKGNGKGNKAAPKKK
jgi:hypothetical protein